jgi:hypothetical protein
MKEAALLLFAMCMAPTWAADAPAVASGTDSPAIDVRASWFKPSLTTNADPICDMVLSDATATFASEDSSYEDLSSLRTISRDDQSDTKVKALEDDQNQYQLTLSDGSGVFVYFQNLTGCGGACDAERVLVSDTRLVDVGYATTVPSSTPNADSWSLEEDDRGNFYAVGMVDGDLQVYRIAHEKDWNLSCQIQLHVALSLPGVPRTHIKRHAQPPPQGTPPAVDQAMASMTALMTAVEDMSGGWGYGACGTSATPARMQADARDALVESLYRPWAVVKEASRIESENSYLDYPRIMESLKLWSLGGVYEHQAFGRYNSQLAQTTQNLAVFYVQNFRMRQDRAAALAQQATTDAVAHAFAFYMYDPFPHDAVLRRAILDRRPLPEIQAIGFDAGQSEKGPAQADSLLDVAIEYPQALDYLLKNGADPNRGNVFGKTPLMYAAQYDQLQSAKLLLAAGADPNATTTAPTDECDYDVRVVHVTALHYAARYASRDFIKLLLADHARAYSRADRVRASRWDKAPGGYPQDWLQYYAGPAADTEKNPHISPSEFDALAKLLKVDDSTGLAHTAADMVIKAEADYAKGKTDDAYDELTAALAAQSDNAKALADMPLVALKAGKVGPALVAADHAIETFKDPPALASAWFNKGLICDRAEARQLFYDGKRCDMDTISPFLKAWQLQSTPVMAKAMKSVFAPGKFGVCEVAKPDPVKGTAGITAVATFGFNGEGIYVYHSAQVSVSRFDIEWMDPQRGKKVAEAVQDIPLEADVISVFKGNYNEDPTIYGWVCEMVH